MSDEKKYTAEGKEVVPQIKKHVPPLAGQNFELLGQICLDFHARPQPGTTLKDVLESNYWSNVCDRLRPSCEIRVIPEDNSWYAKLLVLSTDRISAIVSVITYSDFSQKSTLNADQFEVRPMQNNTRHGIFRKSDSQIIKGGFVTEKQAADFLGDYVRALAA